MEKARPDEMEVAEKTNEEGKEKEKQGLSEKFKYNLINLNLYHLHFYIFRY